jgi:multicomponent Na+:H+ antiporter subunit G
MTGREIVVAILLGVGVLIELLSALGVLALRSPFDRLHYLAPATTIGPLTLAAAVLVADSDAQAKIKAVLLALVLLMTGPILTHATARAAWTRLQCGADKQQNDKGDGQ